VEDFQESALIAIIQSVPLRGGIWQNLIRIPSFQPELSVAILISACFGGSAD